MFTDLPAISPALRQEIISLLEPGERLLWAGRPHGGIVFRAADFFLTPFSILWTAFVFTWEYMAIRSGIIFAIIWGIPFVLIGFYVVIGRFFWDAQVRKHTVYGITDKRVIILRRFPRRKVQSVFIKDIPQLELTEKADGSGTIILGNEPSWAHSFYFLGNHRLLAPSLERIPHVRKIYRLLLELKENH